MNTGHQFNICNCYHLGQVVQSSIKLTQNQHKFKFEFCNFLLWFSVYMFVLPLSFVISKYTKRKKVSTAFKQPGPGIQHALTFCFLSFSEHVCVIDEIEKNHLLQICFRMMFFFLITCTVNLIILFFYLSVLIQHWSRESPIRHSRQSTFVINIMYEPIL